MFGFFYAELANVLAKMAANHWMNSLKRALPKEICEFHWLSAKGNRSDLIRTFSDAQITQVPTPPVTTLASSSSSTAQEPFWIPTYLSETSNIVGLEDFTLFLMGDHRMEFYQPELLKSHIILLCAFVPIWICSRRSCSGWPLAYSATVRCRHVRHYERLHRYWM